MRLAYADPPYPGRAHLYADHCARKWHGCELDAEEDEALVDARSAAGRRARANLRRRFAA